MYFANAAPTWNLIVKSDHQRQCSFEGLVLIVLTFLGQDIQGFIAGLPILNLQF